jgi:hypothetical protein
MQSQKGNLVIVDPHTSNPAVYFRGTKLNAVEGVRVDWDARSQRVTLIVSDATLAAEMKACGIRVRVAV